MGSFRAAKSQAEQSMRHALSQEEALRESEQRFRLLIESVKDYAIIMLDPDGRVVTWNAGAERTKGYRADEILGEHFSRFYPPEDLRAGKPENELWVASDSGRSEDLGWRVRKDGSSFWANVVITAMRDGSGHLRGFSKVTRDITERKQAEDVLESRVVERTAQLNRVNEQLRSELDERRRVENELKASEKRFRSLSASSPIGIFQTDAEGLYIYANERCLSIIGIASGENLGHGWAKTLHPDDREAVFAEWMSAALAARDFSREYRILTSEGEVRWVHARAAVVPADGSDLGGHVGTLEDITGRKRAEEELRTSEERFKILTRATNDAIWDWDLTTNGIWINECVESLFGYPADEVGTDRTWWSDRVHPEDWVWVEPSIQAVLDGDGSFWSGEYRFRHQDGSYSAVFDRGYVIRDGARSPVRMIGSMMDISERKRVLAETLNARQAAEAASRAKSEFLANMSHEIRTPMNGVLGMLDLTLRSDIAPRQRELLGLARSSAETLLRLLNDILDFSKIEAGKLELESTPFSLRETLGDAMETLAMPVHEKGLELSHSVAPDVPDTLVGDPRRLRQVLVNLVGNARKFTEQGEIAVRVERESQAGEVVSLHLTVRDTGIGIAPEKQQHIFTAFTQLDGSTTRQYGGTGLGLAICGYLAEAMGGRIWVESRLGQGSTFHFTAQLGVHDGVVSRPSTRQFNLDRLPVLVVDDNATHLLVLEELLAAWGMRPTAVDGGPAALAAIRQAVDAGEPYPLILLDAMMPEMDGFAVAEQIQRNPELAGTAVVMLSSADLRDDAERCRALGIAAYLRKPIKESDLLDSILAVLGVAPVTRDKPSSPGPSRPATALASAPGPAGGRRPGQSAPGGHAPEKAGPHRRRGQRRPGGARHPGTGVVRPGAHGRSDAPDGRVPGDRRHPREGGRRGPPHPDLRHDGARDEGGPGAVPGGGDGRLHRQADPGRAIPRGRRGG